MIYDFRKDNNDRMNFSVGNRFEKYDLIIDKEDKERILSFPISWHIKSIDGNQQVVSYAVSKGKSAYVTLAQFLLQTSNKEKIIHMNNNHFDFRKKNLKIVYN